jgi:hypothetical protein
MSALTSSPLNSQLHAEPDRPAPRANRWYTPPNQGNRPSESARRIYRCATAPPVETRPRRFAARGTDYVLPSEEGGNPGIGVVSRVNFGPPER